ncbi:MAG TPA: hypothetical protein ENI23_09945 [bacterium]|nr:hypothetical protein [bacterium]
MKNRKLFTVLGEFGLFTVLLLIVFASAISVVSLSPVSFEEVLGNSEDEEKIAGEFTSNKETFDGTKFSPSLATGDVFIGDQKMGNESYSSTIVYNTLGKGENSFGVLNVISSTEHNEFEIRVNMSKDDLEAISVFIQVGNERAELTDELFEGKIFPYRFSMSEGEKVSVDLILESEININFPVETSFDISVVN